MEALLPVLIIWGICGVGCASLAEQKHKDPTTWFWIGFFVGPLAFLILLLIPKG